MYQRRQIGWPLPHRQHFSGPGRATETSGDAAGTNTGITTWFSPGLRTALGEDDESPEVDLCGPAPACGWPSVRRFVSGAASGDPGFLAQPGRV